MANKGPGQPSKFTPEIKEKLLTAIRKGAPYELACNYARIDVKTLWNWKQRAEVDNEPEFVQFFQDLKEAEGLTSLVWLEKIDKAMNDGAWQAAAWKLERRHHKHFSAQAALLEMNERLDRLEKAGLLPKTDPEPEGEEDGR